MRSLTIERSMTIILFALIFALATRVPVDTDTWWHIRSGEYTLTHGMIYADPFSFTMLGQPWINHSWGSQIVLYGAWQLAGQLRAVDASWRRWRRRACSSSTKCARAAPTCAPSR